MIQLDFARYLNIRSATSPKLSPTGERIAFLSDITGNSQVWSAPLNGQQWPQQLTFFPDKVWGIYATPAADHFIAVSDVGGNELQQFYLVSGFGDTSHDVRRLTTNDEAIHRFGAWSSDGTQIVYSSNARNRIDFDLYQMEVASGEATLLLESSGNRIIVAWSPDGTQIITLDAVATEENELYLYDLQTKAERHLTADQPMARYENVKWLDSGLHLLSDRARDTFALCRFDLETGDLHEIIAAETLLEKLLEKDVDNTGGELEKWFATKSGHRAVVVLNVEGHSHLYGLDLETRAAYAIAGVASGVASSGSFNADGSQLFFDLQTPSANPDVWRVVWHDEDDTSDEKYLIAEQLTHSNRAGIDAATFVEPELIHFSSFDGLSIPAFFYRPQSAPPADGYPTILYVHGGPASQQRPDFDVRFQYFLSRGYALLVPNVRGSTGYGRNYMLLDDLELRPNSVADLKAAVGWLHDRAECNADKITIYGRSYGGYMVLAALTEYPELFAAGINVVGIGDWVAFMERTSPWRRYHRGREYGSLEDHRDLLARISPIHKAERIQMPLLVLAGDNDPRVPLYESEQIVDRVRAAGGTVEFYHYADEGHRFSKLENRIDSFTRMAEFLQKYVGLGVSD